MRCRCCWSGSRKIYDAICALIIFAFYPAIIIVRLRDEEALLTRELPGYREYKQKVKYRILPFIW